MVELIRSRQWMYQQKEPGQKGVTDQFMNGVGEFISWAASQHDSWKDREKIRCPCSKCNNMHFFLPVKVAHHLVLRIYRAILELG